MTDSSTICAIITPPGKGAISIIRVSGKKSLDICEKILYFKKPGKQLKDQKANTIHFGLVKNKEKVIDQVLVSVFKEPHSYTGEDVIEISGHGAEYIQQEILQLLIKNGAILAKPGEFTLRAFLNGKMDLSQAEAVADLIASSSEASHKVAIHQMRGGFSDEIKELRKQLVDFLSLIELELDFSDEDLEFASRKEIKELIVKIQKFINNLISSFELGNVIKNGVPVAITGESNVGKSTLLNTLLNDERAIVSEIPGTTRDVIEDVISIKGFSFRFIDTAGLRDTKDKIESLGIERTYKKIKQASIILLMADVRDDVEVINQSVKKLKEQTPDTGKHLIVVLNKTDLASKEQTKLKSNKSSYKALSEKDTLILISAKKAGNIDALTRILLESVKLSALGEHDVIVTNARHYEALIKSDEALKRVNKGMLENLSGDLLAMDIREALHYLGEITGEITSEEILQNIFSRFCIGK